MTTNEHAWVTRLAIILVIIIAGLYISSANAETVIILGSKHFDDKEYNEVNPGICINAKLSGCIFKNSYSNPSASIGYSDYFTQVKGVRIGYSAGLAFGYYEDNLSKEDPIIAAYASIDANYGPLKISFIPGELLDSKNLLVFGVSF